MYFLCISQYISEPFIGLRNMCYNFNVQNFWKFGIIIDIHSETVCLFKHFLLYKFRVYGYTKDPFYGTKISSIIKHLLRKIVPDWWHLYMSHVTSVLNEMTSQIYRKYNHFKAGILFHKHVFILRYLAYLSSYPKSSRICWSPLVNFRCFLS